MRVQVLCGLVDPGLGRVVEGDPTGPSGRRGLPVVHTALPGSGQTGPTVVAELVAAGHTVTGLARSTASASAPKPPTPCCTWPSAAAFPTPTT
jgi:hypothetical protein